MALAKITDHVSRGLGRLAEEFRNKANLTALAKAVLTQVQAIEDALWQLFTERWIDTAVGTQLDVLGKIVGEKRLGETDTDYRLRLRARIKTHKSSGTIEDVLGVFKALTSTQAGATLKLEGSFPAGFILTLGSFTVTASQVAILRDFLGDAKSAAIHAILHWIQSTEAGTFYIEQATTLTVAASAGNTTITVASTTGFPATGSLRLDTAVSGADETVAYTAKTATTFTTAALANAHGLRAAVALVGSTGLGLGDSGNPATGGELAGAQAA